MPQAGESGGEMAEQLQLGGLKARCVCVEGGSGSLDANPAA